MDTRLTVISLSRGVSQNYVNVGPSGETERDGGRMWKMGERGISDNGTKKGEERRGGGGIEEDSEDGKS